MTAASLPFAGDFSPGVVELRKALEIVNGASGSLEQIKKDLRSAFFSGYAQRRSDPAARAKQQETVAYNALLGMVSYRLVHKDSHTLTGVGTALLESGSDDEMYRRLAQHILADLPGLDVLDAIRAIQERRETVSKASLQEELHRAGYELPRATTKHTKMLQWLRKADLLPARGYEIDEDRLEGLIGGVSAARAEWKSTPKHQQAFLLTAHRLVESTGRPELSAKEVIDGAILEFGDAVFPKLDQIRNDVTGPLAESGWIDLSTTSKGRGAKSGTIRPTHKLLNLDPDLIGYGAVSPIPPEISARLATPLSEVFDDLEATNTYTKGIALEVLACRLAADLMLRPTQFRLRGARTGGAEVDLTAEGVHLHHSRWLLQCKNVAGAVSLAALAKEVGMAVMLNAHVIVMVTTGTFKGSVKRFAEQLMQSGQLQVVLVDGDVLEAYRLKGKSALQTFFKEQAEGVFKLKAPQLVSE